MKKRIFIAGIIILMLLPSKTIHADHYKPGSEHVPCNNTYYLYVETSYIQSRSENHIMTPNGMCVVTHYIYSHQKKCNSCYQILGSGIGMECTHVHTRCGTYIKSCGLLYSD